MSGRKRLTGMPLPVKEGRVSTIAFIPDGKIIAAGCNDLQASLVLADVDIKFWTCRAGQIANRNWRRDEWRQGLTAG
jgi:hypothetical protein